jgi:translation initiation factor 1
MARNSSPSGRDTVGGLVYSTEAGRMCPQCGRPVAGCACKTGAPAPAASDGIVRVSHETKGRRGKGVTIVRGLALESAALLQLAQQLKAACGTGGTVKDGTIEIQGDHRERVVAALVAQGRTVKRAGG